MEVFQFICWLPNILNSLTVYCGFETIWYNLQKQFSIFKHLISCNLILKHGDRKKQKLTFEPNLGQKLNAEQAKSNILGNIFFGALVIATECAHCK
jgi:hypothetical protein